MGQRRDAPLERALSVADRIGKLDVQPEGFRKREGRPVMRFLLTHCSTNWVCRGHHAEKFGMYQRRISYLRLYRTASNGTKRVRFPLALPCFHILTKILITHCSHHVLIFL